MEKRNLIIGGFTNYGINQLKPWVLSAKEVAEHNTDVVLVYGSTSQATLVSLAGADFRVAEFFVKGEDSTGSKYSVATVSMVHDATSADYSVYGTVNLPSSSTTGSLGVTYASSIANLVVTPSSSNTTTWTIQYRTM